MLTPKSPKKISGEGALHPPRRLWRLDLARAFGARPCPPTSIPGSAYAGILFVGILPVGTVPTSFTGETELRPFREERGTCRQSLWHCDCWLDTSTLHTVNYPTWSGVFNKLKWRNCMVTYSQISSFTYVNQLLLCVLCPKAGSSDDGAIRPGSVFLSSALRN